MNDLQARVAQAIAARFTSEYKYVPSTERPGRIDDVPATLAERAEMTASVIYIDTDGERSIRFPTCNELAEAAMVPVSAHVDTMAATVEQQRQEIAKLTRERDAALRDARREEENSQAHADDAHWLGYHCGLMAAAQICETTTGTDPATSMRLAAQIRRLDREREVDLEDETARQRRRIAELEDALERARENGDTT